MTGDQHYTEAERLLAAHADILTEIKTTVEGGGITTHGSLDLMYSTASVFLGAAQAHATLALAAATLDAAFVGTAGERRDLGPRSVAIEDRSGWGYGS